MNAVFVVWLLLHYSASTGEIDLRGQYWTERACQEELALRAKVNRIPPSMYRCHKIVIPEDSGK